MSRAGMDRAIAAVRAKAAGAPRRPKRVALPPPVARMLHGFSKAIATKVDAIAARLTPEQRERVRAIQPGFVRAVLANEPDVMQIVALLLAASPDTAALCIMGYLDLFERRFAS